MTDYGDESTSNPNYYPVVHAQSAAIVRGGLGMPASATDADGDGGFVVDSDMAGPAADRPWMARIAKQAVPFPVASLLWLAAESAHANLDVFPLGAPAAASVYLVAAMGYWSVWAKNHPENRATRRLWSTVLIGCGSAWMLWAALAGPTGIALATLVAGGSAAMLPYWTRHSNWQPGRRQPLRPEPEPIQLPEQPEAPELETVTVAPARTANQLHWDTVVAGPGGIHSLADTYLTDPRITDAIEEYTVQLPPGGKVTTSAVLSAAANIAGAYGRSLADVQPLRHPTGAEDKALIRFTRNNPLGTARPYPGPQVALDLTGGNIRTLIGYKANGDMVWWEFYRAGFGTLGGAVFGDTGSGKSFLLRLLIASAAYSGLIVPIVSCPQGGSSFPMWIRHGHWPGASAPEILRQARALKKGHEARSTVIRLRGRGDIHVPTRDEPLVIWWIDEVHKMKQELSPADRKEFFLILDALSREGRKTGFRAIVGDQNPSVPDTFNDQMTLRNSMIGSGGQCVTLRLSSNVEAMIPAVKVKPEKIPAKFADGTPTSGLGALVPDEDMFRVCKITNSDDLAQNAPAMEVEKVIANRMGPDYTQRHERLLNENADLAAELHEDDPELVAEILAANPELAAALPGAIVAREQAKAEVAARAAEPKPEVRELHIDVPRAPGLRVVEPEPEEQLAKNWTCLDAVRKVMRGGVTTFGEIRALALNPKDAPYSETAVRNVLGELIRLGEVKDGGYGRYDYLGQRHGAA